MNHAAANIYGQVQGLMCSGLGTDTQEWLVKIYICFFKKLPMRIHRCSQRLNNWGACMKLIWALCTCITIV